MRDEDGFRVGRDGLEYLVVVHPESARIDVYEHRLVPRVQYRRDIRDPRDRRNDDLRSFRIIERRHRDEVRRCPAVHHDRMLDVEPGGELHLEKCYLISLGETGNLRLSVDYGTTA